MKSILPASVFLIFLCFVVGCGNTSNSSEFLPNPTQPSRLQFKRPEPAPNQKVKNEAEIKETARKTTVLIGGKGKGSGIIVASNGETYYVLTSQHVVGIEPSPGVNVINPQPEENIPSGTPEDPYQVTTYDGKTYTIDYAKVRKDAKFDLALIEFTSNQNYPVANITTTVSEKQTVYVYGLKDCNWTGRDKKEEFIGGTVLSKINPQSSDEGYSVQYTNPTITGMSGSPVFDRAGRVVAIHGKPGKKGKDREYNFEKCEPLEKYGSYLGPNWGISMETFSGSSLATAIGVGFDKTPLPERLSPQQTNNNNSSNNGVDSPIRFKRSNP